MLNQMVFYLKLESIINNFVIFIKKNELIAKLPYQKYSSHKNNSIIKQNNPINLWRYDKNLYLLQITNKIP